MQVIRPVVQIELEVFVIEREFALANAIRVAPNQRVEILQTTLF